MQGSSKKLYKQKGTGRARHGSIRAPIYVGGGRAHPPKPQDWSYRPPRRVRVGALKSALSLLVKEGRFTVVQACFGADGTYQGTRTYDGYPVVDDDGASFTLKGEFDLLTVRDAGNAIIESRAGGRAMIGTRMTPGRVKLGMKMPGHMGSETSSVLNQLVAKIVADQNLILVRGSIPGARGGLVVVRGAIKKNGGKKK